jgi:hypothetical protein
VSPLLIWHIFKKNHDFFLVVVTPCVLDQFYDHWLFSDALNSSFDSFMGEDLGVANKLGLFVSIIKNIFVMF